MKKFLQKIWKHLLVCAVGVFIGLAVNIPSCKQQGIKTIKVPVYDTIQVDSIRIQEKTKVKYINSIDTFYVKQQVIKNKLKYDTVSTTDTVYLESLPIEYKCYHDTIITDSTSTEIDIDYHGFASGIDNIYLKHNYFNTIQIIPEKKKNVSPFIYVEGGPVLNSNFKNVTGAQVGAGAGIYIKDSWGIGAGYDLEIKQEIEHNLKLQIYKKF